MSPIKRFGVRYGSTVKKKVAKIEIKQKKKHKCPYCGRSAVKREFIGIYSCKKCKKRFAGKAFWP